MFGANGGLYSPLKKIKWINCTCVMQQSQWDAAVLWQVYKETKWKTLTIIIYYLQCCLLRQYQYIYISLSSKVKQMKMKIERCAVQLNIVNVLLQTLREIIYFKIRNGSTQIQATVRHIRSISSYYHDCSHTIFMVQGKRVGVEVLTLVLNAQWSPVISNLYLFKAGPS